MKWVRDTWRLDALSYRDRLFEVIAETLGLDATDIHQNQTLNGHLGMDATDRVHVVLSIEEEFDTLIPINVSDAWNHVYDILEWMNQSGFSEFDTNKGNSPC